MLRQHQLRLRLGPSRWAILPSLRSLTIAGVNRLSGSRPFDPWAGIDANQARKRRSAPARAMHKASVSAEDGNSSPPGSHAWQSRSAAEPMATRDRRSAAPSSPDRMPPPSPARRISAKAVLEWVPTRIGWVSTSRYVAQRARRTRAPAGPALPPSLRRMARRFEMKLEQPRPAVRPLKTAAVPGRSR